ncbi:MAG: reverse transcriptase domain-containing protein [Cyanobacteria bacterium J06621_15]
MVRTTTKFCCRELWKKLPWKKFRRNLFRLQVRIFKAAEAGNLAKVRNLQKLVLKSTAAKLLAIRQITQLNKGKRTAGLDGIKKLDFYQRFQVFFAMNSLKDWEPGKLRRISIPKKNGKVRILSIPNMIDRIWQCLIKYAIEPAHEATFHANSYGFRPGRCAHDAQKKVFHNLRSQSNGIQKRIIELDIKKCFDRISHESIMSRILAPMGIKNKIFKALKEGVFPCFPEQGTPQGGVFSPLLANIALNGIEKIHTSIRYADDMIFFLKPKDDEKKILKKVEKFLAERGMEISEEKTKTTSATDGFNFLGWHFYVQKNGKFRSVPSTENYLAFKKKVKTIVNSSAYGAETKAKLLAPIVRGWRNYHRYTKLDGSRFSLWDIAHRAFTVFNKQNSLDYDEAVKLAQKAFPSVSHSENKFVNVAGTKSPFNGEMVYWAERKNQHYDGKTAKLLEKQNYTCGCCGMKFASDETVHLHHRDGNHNNWNDENLVVIHRSRHQYRHMAE